MNLNFKWIFIAVLANCLAVVDVAAAQLTASAPPLSGLLGLPGFVIDKSAGASGLGVSFSIDLHASLGGTVASVTESGGNCSLTYSAIPGSGSIAFGGGIGTTGMNLGAAFEPSYEIQFLGATFSGPLPIVPSFNYAFVTSYFPHITDRISRQSFRRFF